MMGKLSHDRPLIIMSLTRFVVLSHCECSFITSLLLYCDCSQETDIANSGTVCCVIFIQLPGGLQTWQTAAVAVTPVNFQFFTLYGPHVAPIMLKFGMSALPC